MCCVLCHREISPVSLIVLLLFFILINIYICIKNIMLEKQYVIEGILYTVVDTKDVHKRIENDPEFASTYVRNHVSQLEFQVQAETENASDETFVWTNSKIQLLLEGYEKRKEKFRNPTIKKKLLWAEIKTEFMQYNYDVTTEILDKKFRNLKKTYLKIHDNNKKTSTGRGTVTWEYYDTFCKIFDSDKTVCMDNTLSSMVVATKENQILNPNVLDLPPLDLTTEFPTYSGTHDTVVDKHSLSSITVNNETDNSDSTVSGSSNKAKIIKRNYGHRKDVLEMGKQRLEESKKLRDSLDAMVQVQKERNNILTEIAACLKKDCH